MAILMPEADGTVLERRAEIVARLRAIVPGEGVIDSAAEMRVYESDGLTAYRQPPMVVVLPDTTEQVSRVLIRNWKRLTTLLTLLMFLWNHELL